jgi:hypothetical protein
MQAYSSESIALLVVIGFCMAIGIGSIGAADYLSRLATERIGNITPRMFQIFGFAIIGCNFVQLLFVMFNPQSTASVSTDSGEVQYRSGDGGYTMTFSAMPEETAQPQQMGDVSMVLHMTMLRRSNPRWAYGVCYVNTGRDVPLEEAEPSMLQAMTGKLGDVQSTKDITVDGEQGKEYIFRPDSAFVRCRVFSHQSRIYAIVVAGPEDQEDSYADLHFADSFHFIN